MRIYIAKVKETGQRYRFLGKEVWGHRYYSCDFASETPKWYPNLTEARKAAEITGILSTVNYNEELLG